MDDLGPVPIDGEPPAYQDPVWSNYGAGIGVSTGRLTALAVDPTNPNTVYIGGADGGVWKSTDGGNSWTSISDSLPDPVDRRHGIPPGSPKELFVGTGEPNFNQDSYYGYGLYRSGDGGKTFKKIGGSTFDQLTIFRILPKGNGNVVLVATEQGPVPVRGRGHTFSLVLQPGNADNFESFVTDVAFTNQGTASSRRSGSAPASPQRAVRVDEQRQDVDLPRVAAGLRHADRPRPDLARPARRASPDCSTRSSRARTSSTRARRPSWTGCTSRRTARAVRGPRSSPPTTCSTTSPRRSPTSTSAAGTSRASRPGTTTTSRSTPPTRRRHRRARGGLELDRRRRDVERHRPVLGLLLHQPDGEPWCNQGATGLYPTTHPDQHAAGFGVDDGNPVLYVGNDGGVWKQAGPGFNNDSWDDRTPTSPPRSATRLRRPATARSSAACRTTGS